MANPSSTAIAAYRSDLMKCSGHFAHALPVTARKYLNPDRLTQIVCTGLSRNETLLACTRPSVLRAVMDAVQVGLEPVGPLGHAYLVPFRNKKSQAYEATCIIGYKGHIALAMRADNLGAPPMVELVREQDRIDLRMGDPTAPILHDWDLKLDDEARGKVIGGYVIAVGKSERGFFHKTWMSRNEIEFIQSRSPSARKGFSPWQSDWGEMAKKTVIRRAAKGWMLSAEQGQAFAVDDYSDLGRPSDDLTFDADFASELEHVPEWADEGGHQERGDQLAEELARRREAAAGAAPGPTVDASLGEDDAAWDRAAEQAKRDRGGSPSGG